MATRLTTSLRQAARRRVSAVAARVADRLLEHASGWAERISDFAEAARPALRALDSPEEIVVVPRAPDPGGPATTRINGTRAGAAPQRPARTTLAAPNPPPRREDGLLGWRVAQRLRTQVEKRGAILAGPDPLAGTGDDRTHDAEAIRALRVASRRLRAVFELFGHRMPPKTARRLNRRLRRITRALGEVRDADILAGTLRARAQRTDDALEVAALEHAWASVAKRRDRAMRRARKRLGEIDRPALRAEVVAALQPIVTLLCSSDAEVSAMLRDDLDRRIVAAFDKAPIPAPSGGDTEAVHQVRIQAKRLRYSVDLVRPALVRHQEVTGPLRQVQRAIGSSRELDQLHAWLSARRDELTAQGLGTLAKGLDRALSDLQRERSMAARAVPPALAELDAKALRASVDRQLGARSTPRPAPTATTTPADQTYR